MENNRMLFVAIASFIPAGVAYLCKRFVRDDLVLMISLTITYLIIPILFDNLIYNLRWEFKYGPQLSRWHKKMKSTIAFILVGVVVGTVFWVACNALHFEFLDIESYYFAYTNNSVLNVIYLGLSIFYFLLAIPILEELYFRAFVHLHGLSMGLICNLLGYSLLKVILFMFIYPKMKYSLILLWTVFLIIAFAQTQIWNSRGIMNSCGLSIGLSISMLIRFIMLANNRKLFNEPDLFIFRNGDSIWYN